MSADAIFLALAKEAAQALTPYALEKLGEAITNTQVSDDQDRTAEIAAETTASRLSSIALIRLILKRNRKAKALPK